MSLKLWKSRLVIRNWEWLNNELHRKGGKIMNGMIVIVALNILFMNLLIVFFGRDIDNLRDFKRVLVTTSLLNVVLALVFYLIKFVF